VILRKAKALLALLRRRAVAREDAGQVPLAMDEPRRPGLAQRRLTEAFFEPLPADELAA
jgi:hypothetical protein